MNFINKFKEDKGFANALTFQLFIKLSHPDNTRLPFLRQLFNIILEGAISMLDLYDTYQNGRLIQKVYNQALAHSKDTASRLLQELSDQASEAEKDTVPRILLPLMKELLLSVNTGSLEVQSCFQLLVKAYIIKSAGKEPLKPESWARPAEVELCRQDGCDKCAKLNAFLKNPEANEITVTLSTEDQKHLRRRFKFLTTVSGKGGEVRFTKTMKWWEEHHCDWERETEKAKQNLQKLPQNKLKQALGKQYNELMSLDLVWPDGDTAKAELATRRKRLRSESLGREAPETAKKAKDKEARENDG